LDVARRRGVGVHLDSMHPDTADRTLALLPLLLAVHPGLGCTLPGRWARSVEDARYVTDLGVRSVRVVKGQWADPADPRRDARAGVLAVVDALRSPGVGAGGRAGPRSVAGAGARSGAEAGTRAGLEVGVATHDAPLA